ncbi:MAG TPA: site-2 protease family protein [Candidatus Paceibacterota bacterium]|nr:site-2 protease family protein [Candidatus Paceibacterota bacterium]
MDQISFLIFQLAVLIFSVMIHELSHGYVAEHLGDPTARLAGRLTFNPLKHLDFFGSFVFPVFLFMVSGGSFVFGWAKPVPYNPVYLKDPKTGAGKIAAAGPVSNLIIAVVFGVILRMLPLMNVPADSLLYEFFAYIAYINVLLAIFNLVPLPPLDGSKVLFSVLPQSESSLQLGMFLERYGMILLLIFVFFGFQLITPVVHWLFSLITGF